MPQMNVDRLAEHLLSWADLAKRQPPAWAGCGDAVPICGPEREPIGRMLPGKGLYLEHDLKTLGITRNRAKLARAGVYEASPIRKLTETLAHARRGVRILLADEQAAITSYDNIINARANGFAQDITVQKASLTTVANAYSSLWQAAGLPAAGGFSATPGVAPNNTTVGALSTGLSTPGSGNMYLLSFGYNSSSALDMLILVDLLSQVGSLSATSAANQAIASAALTRYTTGAGVYMVFEVTTAIGTTASNLTVTYTNQAGTTGQVTPLQAMTPSMIVSRMLPAATGPQMPLATGDYGVRQVTNIKLSAAMTAGVFALQLYKQLMFIPGIVANIYVAQDSTIQISALQQLFIGTDSALGCLGAFVQTSATSSGLLIGAMQCCSG